MTGTTSDKKWWFIEAIYLPLVPKLILAPSKGCVIPFARAGWWELLFQCWQILWAFIWKANLPLRCEWGKKNQSNRCSGALRALLNNPIPSTKKKKPWISTHVDWREAVISPCPPSVHPLSRDPAPPHSYAQHICIQLDLVRIEVTCTREAGDYNHPGNHHWNRLYDLKPPKKQSHKDACAIEQSSPVFRRCQPIRTGVQNSFFFHDTSWLCTAQ